MMTLEVLSLSIHYLISVWTTSWWNLNKIVWSKPLKKLCFLTTNGWKFLTKCWRYFGTFLRLKQLFDAKIWIERLSSFSVPKITAVRHWHPGCKLHQICQTRSVSTKTYRSLTASQMGHFNYNGFSLVCVPINNTQFRFLYFRINPRLPKDPPLRIIFRPAKTLKFTIKWVQLIVGSSFPVILAQTNLLPYPGVGVR